MLNAIRRLLIKSSEQSIINSVIADSLTYLEESALRDLYELVKSIEQKNGAGILIEAGCALGGSAIVIAAAKSKNRTFNVYDVFGMIPQPSDKDDADVHERYKVIADGQSEGIGNNKYYGYEENLYDKVKDNFRTHGIDVDLNNVNLIKGLFQNTIEIDERVAMAHIDGDWYESVTTCLERIEPHLVQGGVLVIDDYDAWSGCRKAVDDYFRDKREFYDFIKKSRLHIVRKLA